MSGRIYNARLKKNQSKKTTQFLSSIEDDLKIFEADIEGTEAHNIMLHEQKIITEKELNEILTSLEKLQRKFKNEKVLIEPEYEDVHEFIETYVIQDIGIEVGGKLHTGRSRNDQVALDIRMTLRLDLINISEKLLNLISILIHIADKHSETMMPLYTHTQHAQVGTLAHYLISYVDILIRDLQRIDSCYERVNLSPLGAGPIGGTSIPIDRKRTASLLGFDGLVENSIDAVSSKDVEIEALSILANLMVSLSRIAEDIILWSSTEFGYIELADEYSSTSSIMPQKKNPCTLELIRGRTGRAVGALNGILSMMKSLVTGYNRDLQETKHHLWKGLETVHNSLEILTGAIETMKVNKIRMMERVTEGYALALDLAETLVVKSNLPFREAHKLVGNLISKMVVDGRKISQLKPDAIKGLAEKLLNKQIAVDPELIKRTIDPEYSLQSRKSMGSPNPTETKRILKTRTTTLITLRENWLSRKNALEKARKLFKETVKNYCMEF